METFVDRGELRRRMEKKEIKRGKDRGKIWLTINGESGMI